MAEGEETAAKEESPSQEQQQQQPQQAQRRKEMSMEQICLIHAILAIAFMASLLYAIFNGCISLHPHEDEVYMQDFISKIEFLIKYQSPNVFIALMFVCYVISIRVRYPPVSNPLSGNEEIVQKAKNILTNTMEQYVIYLVAQFMLITYLDSQMVVKLIPFNCWCFFIGRLTFAIGYPIHRDFGMLCTLIPNICAVFYCLYKFFHFINVPDFIDFNAMYNYIHSLYLV